MKTGQSKSVPVYNIETVSGKKVYRCRMGRKFYLKKESHLVEAFTIDPPIIEWNQKMLARATEQLGEPCRWVPAGTTQIMNVFL